MSLAIRISELSANPLGCQSAWKGKTGLMCLVAEAVEETDWPTKGNSFAINGGAPFPADGLMSLLTYCYATGIYGSMDIERSAQRHRALRKLFPDDPPDWHTIRRFRRLHREPLRECLVNVVHQALRIRFGAPDQEPPLADHCVAVALDRWFDPLCVPNPAKEASHRIERAVIHDEVLFD